MSYPFGLYVAALRRLAACQDRAASLYRASGQPFEAGRAARIATESRLKADRLEAACR